MPSLTDSPPSTAPPRELTRLSIMTTCWLPSSRAGVEGVPSPQPPRRRTRPPSAFSPGRWHHEPLRPPPITHAAPPATSLACASTPDPPSLWHRLALPGPLRPGEAAPAYPRTARGHDPRARPAAATPPPPTRVSPRLRMRAPPRASGPPPARLRAIPAPTGRLHGPKCYSSLTRLRTAAAIGLPAPSASPRTPSPDGTPPGRGRRGCGTSPPGSPGCP